MAHLECQNGKQAKNAQAKISDMDFERLQDHVRLLHGLEKRADAPQRKTDALRRRNSVALFPKPTSEPTTTMSPCLAAVAAAAGVDLGLETTPSPEVVARRPRLNKTYQFRRECVQKRIDTQRRSFVVDLQEAQRIHEHNLQPKQNEYFRLNKAFHMRWKNIRGLPVVPSHFRNTYLDTGKPPFVVPVHYKPFNVYWDADYAKQEFIFLDAASEEKKKDEKKKEEKKKEEEKKKAKEPLIEPTTKDPRRKSSGRKDSLEQSSSPDQPRKSSSHQQEPPPGQPRKNSSSLLQEPPPGQPRKKSSSLLQEPPPGQPRQKSSSLLTQERRDRESTGYEGFPRDSELEAALNKSPNYSV